MHATQRWCCCRAAALTFAWASARASGSAPTPSRLWRWLCPLTNTALLPHMRHSWHACGAVFKIIDLSLRLGLFGSMFSESESHQGELQPYLTNSSWQGGRSPMSFCARQLRRQDRKFSPSRVCKGMIHSSASAQVATGPLWQRSAQPHHSGLTHSFRFVAISCQPIWVRAALANAGASANGLEPCCADLARAATQPAGPSCMLCLLEVCFQWLSR